MRAAILPLLLCVLRLDAQVVETPVAFDSAGRIRSITPGIAARLLLAPPAWPVTGHFVAARLYSSSEGGDVLVVERPNGALERYALDASRSSQLRSSVDVALARAGTVVAETESEAISRPARAAFVRNQMLLGALVYGPLAASLANDAKTGTVLYLVGAGGTYFALTAMSRTMRVTRAQNHLATDGALRGLVTANGLLLAVAGGVPDAKTAAGVGLLGAVAGSVSGFHYGRRLTDAEAHAATTGSSFLALTAAGIEGAAGLFETDNVERGIAASLVAAGAAGYLLGPRYPRRARYVVTAGDVKILWVGAVLGAAITASPIVDTNVEPGVAFGLATAGMLGGIGLSEMTWVRRYDHSMGDVVQVWLGTIAGGLLGGAAVVLTSPSDASTIMSLITAGATIGAIGAHKLVRPPRASPRSARLSEPESTRRAGARVEFTPMSVALALKKVPGVHPLLTLRF